MTITFPTDVEIAAAIERAAFQLGVDYDPTMVQCEDTAIYDDDGRRDWSRELAELRRLVEILPHAHFKGTPGSAASTHYIQTGHRLGPGCCVAQFAA